jgi:hypothetical protein
MLGLVASRLRAATRVAKGLSTPGHLATQIPNVGVYGQAAYNKSKSLASECWRLYSALPRAKVRSNADRRPRHPEMTRPTSRENTSVTRMPRRAGIIYMPHSERKPSCSCFCLVCSDFVRCALSATGSATSARRPPPFAGSPKATRCKVVCISTRSPVAARFTDLRLLNVALFAVLRGTGVAQASRRGWSSAAFTNATQTAAKVSLATRPLDLASSIFSGGRGSPVN